MGHGILSVNELACTFKTASCQCRTILPVFRCRHVIVPYNAGSKNTVINRHDIVMTVYSIPTSFLSVVMSYRHGILAMDEVSCTVMTVSCQYITLRPYGLSVVMSYLLISV